MGKWLAEGDKRNNCCCCFMEGYSVNIGTASSTPYCCRRAEETGVLAPARFLFFKRGCELRERLSYFQRCKLLTVLLKNSSVCVVVCVVSHLAFLATTDTVLRVFVRKR